MVAYCFTHFLNYSLSKILTLSQALNLASLASLMQILSLSPLRSHFNSPSKQGVVAGAASIYSDTTCASNQRAAQLHAVVSISTLQQMS